MKPLNLLLADDDLDDCLFFQEAIDELPLVINLSVVNNGNDLMEHLSQKEVNLPDLLFLDLNMPLKNGFECLTEIKLNTTLKKLPVIIYSTSLDPEIVDSLYNTGAHHFIRKPADFTKLKTTVHKAIQQIQQTAYSRPTKEKFIFQL